MEMGLKQYLRTRLLFVNRDYYMTIPDAEGASHNDDRE